MYAFCHGRRMSRQSASRWDTTALRNLVESTAALMASLQAGMQLGLGESRPGLLVTCLVEDDVPPMAEASDVGMRADDADAILRRG